MIKALGAFGATALAALLFLTPTSYAQQKYEDVTFQYNGAEKAASLIKRNAAFFKADGKKAVILAHQAGAEKEGWYFLSEIFQQKGMASLALQRTGTEDVLGGIDYLKSQGYTDISLLGASLGGGSIMRAMDVRSSPEISRVVLLAPGPGPALQNQKILKLVIVARQDFYSKRAYDAYRESTEPKILKEYPGHDHAQKLFETRHREDLITTVVKFLGLEPLQQAN